MLNVRRPRPEQARFDLEEVNRDGKIDLDVAARLIVSAYWHGFDEGALVEQKIAEDHEFLYEEGGGARTCRVDAKRWGRAAGSGAPLVVVRSLTLSLTKHTQHAATR